VTDHAERYARIAAAFDRRVVAVSSGRWTNPTPCDGWLARDIVGHLVEWVPGFMSTFAGLEPPTLVARATGLDDRLDPDAIAGMVDGMEPYDEMLRSSGHYGPRFPIDDESGANEQNRLLAFLGRDPNWSAP